MIRDAWYLHRRAVLISCGMVAVLVLLLGAAAIALRATSPSSAARGPDKPKSSAPTDYASDSSYWDAMPAVRPAPSKHFPAVTAAATQDPTSFAEAFATELFSRKYGEATRDELLGWAQYEDAPLDSPRYPRADWTKVLVDSLTDLSWDGALDTPVPAAGAWSAFASAHAVDSVSDVVVSVDPTWEQKVADGFQPSDRLATARDVTLTVTQAMTEYGRRVVHRYAVSLALQLGTSPRGGYGIAVTNNFVSKEMG